MKKSTNFWVYPQNLQLFQLVIYKFRDDYSSCGRKAKPVRLMVGLLLLKQMYNLSDERLIEMWCENPYFQVFCGIKIFQWNPPCDPSDLTYFRKRIGENGIESILKISIEIHGDKALEKEIIVDTTVQVKNITFPTDTKLYLKIIWRCLKIAKAEDVHLRRSYKNELKSLIRDARFDKSKEGQQKAEVAKKRIKEIARLLIQEVYKKLLKRNIDKYNDDFDRYTRIINQTKDDTNKIYSLHEHEVKCIKKGKSHVEYEFGSKASVAVTSDSGIIVSAKVFSDNRHDSKTLQPVLDQVESMTGQLPEIVIADRGYRGYEKYKDVELVIPKAPKQSDSESVKCKAKERCKRRNAIEPIIGHLKTDFRLCRNFLKGVYGDIVNLIMAAAAFNCKKWMRLWAERPLLYLFADIALIAIAFIMVISPC